jgi:hypothetical protein
MNQQSPEQIQQQQDQIYVDAVVKRIQSGDESLNDTERRLGHKYLESNQTAGRLNSQANNLRQEIEVKQAQLSNIEDEIKREFGRAGGILEALLALREPGDTPADPPGNGSTKPDKPSKDKE